MEEFLDYREKIKNCAEYAFPFQARMLELMSDIFACDTYTRFRFSKDKMSREDLYSSEFQSIRHEMMSSFQSGDPDIINSVITLNKVMNNNLAFNMIQCFEVQDKLMMECNVNYFFLKSTTLTDKEKSQFMKISFKNIFNNFPPSLILKSSIGLCRWINVLYKVMKDITSVGITHAKKKDLNFNTLYKIEKSTKKGTFLKDLNELATLSKSIDKLNLFPNSKRNYSMNDVYKSCSNLLNYSILEEKRLR